jgi:hypothetical protein
MRCSDCMQPEQRSVRSPIGSAGIDRRSIGSSAAIERPMGGTCRRPRAALAGPGACASRRSCAAASMANWSATGLRWGGRPSRSPADGDGRQPSTGSATSPSTAGSTARSGGASACSATWRAPSHAGTAASRRPARTGDPEPHADPLASGQGQLPYRVRPLGGRSGALSPAT